MSMDEIVLKKTVRKCSWRAMETLYLEGKVRTTGDITAWAEKPGADEGMP